MFKKFLVLICISFMIGACSKSPEESLLLETRLNCSEKTVPNQYVAKWKDGSISTVSAETREDLIEQFIRPNLNALTYVEPNFKIQIDQPEITTTATSQNEWGQDRIDVDQAWDQNILGQSILIAVIDTGVEITHAYLKNNIYVNGAEKNGNPGVDDDHNGLVDDISGWNFTNNSNQNIDEVGHGTHVAGIVAAEHLNSTQIGIAPKSKILPLDFMSEEGGETSAAVKSIDYAFKMGAKIINASWGGDACAQTLEDKLKELETKNVLFIVAAGNSGHNLVSLPEYPAAFVFSNQITVGASNINNYLAAFSNYGPLVDLVAPGDKIYSTYTNNSFFSLSGTSMATPFVTGVAALLWSANPTSTATEIKDLILSGVTPGLYNVKTRGLLNVGGAL